MPVGLQAAEAVVVARGYCRADGDRATRAGTRRGGDEPTRFLDGKGFDSGEGASTRGAAGRRNAEALGEALESES